MSKSITAKFKRVGKKEVLDATINTSDEVHALLEQKKVTIELVELDSTTTTVYACSGDHDIFAVTRNLKFADNAKEAFQKIIDYFVNN